MLIYTEQGDTVDQICWRYLAATQGTTEQVYELNPGLAEMGAHLPQGTRIILPDAITPPETQTFNLWD
jgi:phage tail protein X